MTESKLFNKLIIGIIKSVYTHDKYYLDIQKDFDIYDFFDLEKKYLFRSQTNVDLL